MGTNLTGPTLVDLRYVYYTQMDMMAYLASLLAFGYMAGALVTSIMSYFNRQIAIAFAILLQSLTLGAMPHCGVFFDIEDNRGLYLLYVVAVIYGIGGGIFDSSFNLWIVEMWPRRSEPVLQVFYLILYNFKAY